MARLGTSMYPLQTGMAPRTAVGAGGSLFRGFMGQGVPDGQYTSTVYSLLRDGRFREVISLLNAELVNHPRSRAALSLLGYSYYHVEDYLSAAGCYEELLKYYPNIEEYKLYYAQSLYKAALFDESVRACASIENMDYAPKVHKLQASAYYQVDDFTSAANHLDSCVAEDPDVILLQASILFKEEKFDEALTKFAEASGIVGHPPDLEYNVALCHYRMRQWGPSLKIITDIIEKGIREHPELSVGSSAQGIEVRSVGNTLVLKETALVEAFNLKCAIEYQLKNVEASREALLDIPPRSEEELDITTLHNQALVNMDEDPSSGFAKLAFLLQHPPFPPETFGNLLMLYCKYEYFDLAADLLAENAHLTYVHLSQDVYDLLDAMITSQTSPEEAFRKFEDLSKKHIEVLRTLTKKIQEARIARDGDGIKSALKEYDDSLEQYIPVLMGQAKIYWDLGNYEMVEKLFRQSAEFCVEHDTWKLNVAHVFYMQENKFEQAIQYYEPIVKRMFDTDILSIPAMTLANLCVSYIMTNQNEEAEELMRKIEHEEELAAAEDPEKQLLHLCIVNLVIGTLYCSKMNFEFGVSRIVKSLEPFSKKIMPITWHYAKRCLLALVENAAKHILTISDDSMREVLEFLDQADFHGKEIFTSEEQPLDSEDVDRYTVSQEARLLKRMFLRLKG